MGRRRRKFYSIADVTAARVAFQRAHSPTISPAPPILRPAPLVAGEKSTLPQGGGSTPLAPDPHVIRGESATPSNTERGDA